MQTARGSIRALNFLLPAHCAYWDNPIVKASYMQSGTSLKALRTQDYAHTNFTFVAKNLGCDFPDEPVAELARSRPVPSSP